MPLTTSCRYTSSSAGPPGKFLWILGSANGSVIVIITVASLLGGSSGLSYWVFTSRPLSHTAKTAFSHASGRQSAVIEIAGMLAVDAAVLLSTFLEILGR